MLGKTATVLVDGEEITGTVYNVRDNGWYCVESPQGRVASGPEVQETAQDIRTIELLGA